MIVSAVARADLAEAADWYDQQRPGLGDEFVRHVGEMLEAIERMPEAFAIVRKDVRKTVLRRFPYLIYYRIVDDEVVIIAILHGRRDPNRWRSRI